MKHSCVLTGYAYRLRPVELDDAGFIVDIRTSNVEKNRYVHSISNDVEKQIDWINAYYSREGDYYFVIENRITKEPEGLISFYNVHENKAEWGRWILKDGSLAAPESVYLLYRIAFEQVHLEELYCKTIKENKSVVSFHNSAGELLRNNTEGFIKIDGTLYEYFEHYSNPDHFYNKMSSKLEGLSRIVLNRMLKREMGGFVFHHLGIASKDIIKDQAIYTLLGYHPEGSTFVDENQGIKGCFMCADLHPRIELLQNLEDFDTVSKQLNNKNIIYHMGFLVNDIGRAKRVLELNRAKTISPLKRSVYFEKQICFMMLPNMMMIELIEA